VTENGGPVTIVLHDWRGTERGAALASSIADAPATSGARRLAVVARGRLTADRALLEGLGFEIVAVGDGASPRARKNAGMAGASGDVVLLASEAKVVDEQWLGRMLEEATSRGAGVAGCKVVDDSGNVVNTGYHLLQPECDKFDIGGGKKDINQYYYTREVEAVDSRCMYISRAAREAAGGFDEGYTEVYSDLDFCLKARSEGFRVVDVGSTRIAVARQVEHASASTRELADASRAAFRERWREYNSARYDTRVMWHSWINAPTGYAVSSQYLVLALEELGVDVRYGFVYGVEEPPNDDERIMEVRRKPKDLDVTQVVYGQGDVFFKNSGRYRVGYSMLEVTGIPADWVEQANALDEIWVPSHFNKETFSSSGVTSPIQVMPLGVDTNHFHPYIRSWNFDDRYVFVSVFEWAERKAPGILLRAYNQEFSSSDDVLLLMKVTNTQPGVNIERQVEAMRLRADRAPVVMVVNQNIPSYQMGSLYCSSDCFVLPTRGEGWGMPTLEAMACGLPAISTPWSAQTEFFNEDVGYPIDVKGLVPAAASWPYYEGFEWADPDVDHLASLMRHVYENREEARAKGMRASVWARERWTWLDAAARIKERLIEIAG
jgi:glycosyltransferase involved in cell wall biosynthesis